MMLLVIVHFLIQVTKATKVKLDPDVGKSTVELIEARGYVAETHNVTTADGYILTLHRLPMSHKECRAGKDPIQDKPVVLVQHGLLDTSFSWVCNFRNQSLAFVLADAGYDVWLGNNRGNTYSSNHVNCTTNDDAFWDFTWEDMGKFDLPAMIKYVRKTSGRKTISYVGYSEGVMQALVTFSEDQSLAKSVSYFAAMGPVAWLGHTNAKAFKFFSKAYADTLLQVTHQAKFFPHNEMLQEVIGAKICTSHSALCKTGFALLAGGSKNWNSSRVSVYLSEMPAGTSVKNLSHFAQNIRKDTFSAYSYGCGCLRALGISMCPTRFCENKAKYGSFDPPAFPVSKMKYPRTGFFRGEMDILSIPADMDHLRAALPPATVIHDENISSFSHLDFIWATNANEKVYQSVLEQLNRYNGHGY
ncbi:unnamed protein product [Peronospora destructor]|uniref:Lipase n=1 Tax=Peronospora destructor TaxID=86335 RepID=A0AAV0T551_9STRA|nr:unnamed protein product [Peronospora destructor]